MLYWVHVWRTHWPFHLCDSFLEKKIIHQIIMMGPAIIAHEHDIISNCCRIRGYSRSDELIPKTTTNQSSNLNGVEIDAPISRNASIVHHSPPHCRECVKSDTYAYYQYEQKNRMSEKRIFLHSLLPTL
ncbi:hypothetical protein TNCV_4413481 [Trichonephila clavipes]|nr:hypothetical protein TNCV_4413481 [Trichonephila clavipes]